MTWLAGVVRLLERGARPDAGAFPVHLYSFHEHVAKALRCHKALRVLYLMNKWREATCARVVALYWLDVTQRALCAPGGRGRKRDLDAYASEFVHAS